MTATYQPPYVPSVTGPADTQHVGGWRAAGAAAKSRSPKVAAMDEDPGAAFEGNLQVFREFV